MCDHADAPAALPPAPPAQVYSNFAWVDRDGYLREFVMKDRADAIDAWMSGDEPSMAQAERKAAKLVQVWLAWFRTQSVEALPGVRIDVLIKRTGPGAAEVFTLELTELGFSMLGVAALPPMVFAALLRSCFEDTGPTTEEAARLADGTKRLTAKPSASAPAREDGEGDKKRRRGGEGGETGAEKK